jgi:hypothetical protein
MPKLASCPFCGGEAIRWPAGELADEGIINELAGCYGNDPERRHPFLRMTPTAWNTRKSDDGWRTMESAPKDGMPILLGYFHKNLDGSIYQEGGAPVVAAWIPTKKLADDGAEINWVAITGRLRSSRSFSPTHWRPLPSPPEG